MAEPRLPWNRDPRYDPNLPRDEDSVLRYTGDAVYPNSSSLGGWVYQSGPLSVLELDRDGGRLLPSTLGSLASPLLPMLGSPHVRFAWSEVEKVEAIRSVLPWPAGVRFWLRGRDGFFIGLGLRPKASYKVLDFAESKGAAACREPVFTWTGRAPADHRSR